MSGFTDTDKDRVQSLEVKSRRIYISGVSKPLVRGQIIDRGSDNYIFNQIYKSGTSIAPLGNHSGENFEVNQTKKRSGSLEIWVSKNGSDLNEGTRDKPIETFSKAISVANQYKSEVEKLIRVLPGNYSEDLVVEVDNLKIIGNDPNDSSIKKIDIESGVKFEIEDVKVETLNVKDSNTTVWYENVEITSNLDIENKDSIKVFGSDLKVTGTINDPGFQLAEFSSRLIDPEINFWSSDRDVIVNEDSIYTHHDVTLVGDKPKFIDTPYDGGSRFALMNMHENPGFVILLEILDKGEPKQQDYIEINNGPNAVKFDPDNDKVAYVVTNTGKTRKLEIDGRTLKNGAQVDSGGQIFNLDIDDTHVYGAGAAGDGLIVIDKESMTLSSKTTFNAGDVAVKNDNAFITDYSNADLRVYDTMDKQSPSQIATLSVGSFPVLAELYGDYLYVQEYNGSTFYVIDVSSPSSPSIVNTVSSATGRSLRRGGIIKEDDILYVFSSDGYLDVYSGASSPSSLTKEFNYELTATNVLEPVAKDGDYFWVPDFDNTTFSKLKNPFIWNEHLDLKELDVRNRVGNLPFTPNDSSNWSGSDPTSIQEAINRIADDLASNHSPIN